MANSGSRKSSAVLLQQQVAESLDITQIGRTLLEEGKR
jgi:hypothetical protein